MAAPAWWKPYIAQRARQMGLDPQAVLAVANQEGLSGRVGDGGHAFGPFQLNDAGGVLTNRPGDHRQFAESQAGIDWALGRIAGVARGQHGAQAVNSIVRRFERPKDPNGEVARALGMPVNAAWGTPGAPRPPKGQPPAAPGLAGLTQDSGALQRNALLQNLISQQNAYLGVDTGPNLAQQMQQFNLMQQSQGGGSFFQAPQASPAGRTAAPYTGRVKFLGNTQGENQGFLGALGQAVSDVGGSQVRLISGYRSPEHNKAIGGAPNSLHTRGAAMDGEVLIGGKWVPLGAALLPVARRYGLRSGDVPGFFNGKPDPNHVDYGLRA